MDPNPQTPAEWQEAVDAAAACRALHDCKLYGLLEGGPSIDAARCDELLDEGKSRGVVPSQSAEVLAIAFVAEFLNVSQEQLEEMIQEVQP